MKSKTIKYLEYSIITFNILFVYYFLYNLYFGFNEKPISETEKICDSIAIVLFFTSIWFFISAIYYFIILVVNYIKIECYKDL